MATQRAHVSLPEDLIKEIDEVVGPRGRSAFLVETARAELRRRWLLDYFSKGEPIWKDEDHAEWADRGSVANWVRALRREGETVREEPLPVEQDELQSAGREVNVPEPAEQGQRG